MCGGFSRTLEGIISMIRDFIYNHEPLWLFIILLAGLAVEVHSNYMLRKEYQYDEQKDLEKKQRRTKTTKKTTNKAGESIVEETVETSEPMEDKRERNEQKVEQPK